MEKKIKKHGMSSEKAKRVKGRGHKKEFIYSQILRGEVVRGTKKGDVEDKNGKFHSLKGGSEIKNASGRKGKWQLFLYRKSRFQQETDFPGREFILEILDSFPPLHEDYAKNKEVIKRRLEKPMKELKDFLCDKENLYDFFDKSILDKRVSFFVVYDDDSFHVFEREEAMGIFTRYLEVENNRSLQKVVFKYDNKIISELEYRTTDDGKYPAMLLNMQNRSALALLQEKTGKSELVNPVVLSYGSAIEYFKNYEF